MKKHLLIATTAFLFSALCFVVICTASDLNGNSISAASSARPFKGTWGGVSYIFQGACGNGSNLIIETAKGFSTLTGASEWYATHCLDPLTGHGDGNAVIVASNGDAILLAITIQLTPTSEEGGTWVESEIVLGGTGRFADASGGSTSKGNWKFSSPTTVLWSGTHEGELFF